MISFMKTKLIKEIKDSKILKNKNIKTNNILIKLTDTKMILLIGSVE